MPVCVKVSHLSNEAVKITSIAAEDLHSSGGFAGAAVLAQARAAAARQAQAEAILAASPQRYGASSACFPAIEANVTLI